MEVVVRLVPEAAKALREDPSGDRAHAFQDVANSFGVKLLPMHRQVCDGKLATFFVIDYADPRSARRLTESLRHLQDVSAAYVKAAAEPAVN